MIDYKKLLQENRPLWKKRWSEGGNVDNLHQICGLDDWDYDIIIDWIIKNKPKTIVEYGSGESTFIIQTLLDLMDYEYNLFSYENQKNWYDKIKETEFDKNNVVNLVECVPLVTEVAGKKFQGCRYNHSYENIPKPDLVIIDGPDLRIFDPVLDTTINLKEMFEFYNTDTIHYYIDGRRGTKNYYKYLGYEHLNIENGYNS